MKKLIAILQSLRPHQWIKGGFIVLPLIFGEKLLDREALIRVAVTVAAFSLASSAIYLLNDILDVNEDRNHPEKKNRPIAAGMVGIFEALCFSVVLMVSSLVVAYQVGLDIAVVITVYLVLNFSYIRFLKHAVIIDVFCLSAFFYLRILAGSFACHIELSTWMVMCTVLLSLFIGLNKRRYDLEFSKYHRPVLRKYNKYFIDRMISIIATSILMAYTFYVMDDDTALRFETNHIYYTVPFVYYGIFRYLYLVDMKWYGGDPSKIVFKDYKMILTLLLWLIVVIAAIYFHI